MTRAVLGQGSEVMVKFGVVGYGYWGPNVVRNLDHLEEAEVVAVCDKSAAARKKVARAYPDVRVTDNAGELMTSPEIDAIAVRLGTTANPAAYGDHYVAARSFGPVEYRAVAICRHHHDEQEGPQ